MNAFIDLQAKNLELYSELVENPVPAMREYIEQQLEVAKKILLKRRLERSWKFDFFFQALMEV